MEMEIKQINRVRRFSDALAIQEGACNPSGIAHSIVNACREIRETPNYGGTDALTGDPALRLMVHQLAYICGVLHGVEEFAREPHYSRCTALCRKEALRRELIERGAGRAGDGIDYKIIESTHNGYGYQVTDRGNRDSQFCPDGIWSREQAIDAAIVAYAKEGV